jgi:hypothetical protein
MINKIAIFLATLTVHIAAFSQESLPPSLNSLTESRMAEQGSVAQSERQRAHRLTP